MRKVFCRVSIPLAVLAMFAGAPAIYAQNATPHELESSLMKYVLCYEAYKEAKQSENPEVRADLAKYVKEYREAYAEYLQILHEADIYQPDKKEMDPANDYNKIRVSHGGKKIIWKNVSNDKEREKIKNGIKAGKSYNEILKEVKSSLPKEPISEEEKPIELDDNDGIIYGNEGVNTGGNNLSDFSNGEGYTEKNKPDEVIYNNPTGNTGYTEGNGGNGGNGAHGKPGPNNNGRGYHGGPRGPMNAGGQGPNMSNLPWCY